MKKILLIVILIILSNQFSKSISHDSINYKLSVNYCLDLSDSYGKGDLLNSEFFVTKSWYGVSIGYGHFNGHSTIYYSVFVEDLNKTIEIQLDEVSFVKSGSLSFLFIPIKSSFFETEIIFGLAYSKATISQFKNVDYNYDLINDRFKYLYKNYILVKKDHFGYQAGFNISFFPVKNAGIQLNSRIQHLNNGGSFFFVGGGVCFRF
ncbi:MAG: hypothetical protein HPY62_03465 [Bacteroidales bacterium]|nr:hypothetical protein [Bacteroidales bacterium]